MDFESIARRIASGGRVRTAGKIEFVKDQGPVRRDVRVKGYQWSSDALRDLAKILWAGQRAHSYAMAALRTFSKMPSSEFSPDGLLGGRGYIQSVKDMRSSLANTVEILSSFTDTVHDEVHSDHWASVENKADIGNIVSNVERVKGNPEGFVEGQFENEEGEPLDEDEDEDEPLVNPRAENPEVDGDDGDEDGDEDEDEAGSQLPPDVPRTSATYDRYAMAFDSMMSRTASRVAGGGLDELVVPGAEPTITDRDLNGPRAYPLGPAAGGELGNFDDPCCQERPDDDSAEATEMLLDNGLFLPSEGEGGGADFNARMSANLPEGFSWLPGADNRKPMNWYGLGNTEADMKWMEEHCQPDVPKGILPEEPEFNTGSLWDEVRVY